MFFVIIGTPKREWVFGALSAVIFSLGSEVLSMIILSQRKIIFVPIGIIIGIIAATLLGICFASQSR
jgi:hypothetical protein